MQFPVKALCFILTVIMLTSCLFKKEVWTKEYEQQASNDLDRSLQHTVKDSIKRREMVQHVIKELKNQLPGGLESIPAPSLHNLTYNIERQFATSQGRPKVALPWTDVNEENLRIALIEQYTQQIPEPNRRMAFCNCLITQLKALQPDSLRTPVSDTTLTQLTKTCR